MVETSATHLLELINEILDISKIESGRVDLDDRIVLRRRRWPTETLKAVTPLAEAKGLALAAEGPPEDLRLESDRRRVKQVLMNLLGNAVKFSDKGIVRLDVEAFPDADLTVRRRRPAASASGPRTWTSSSTRSARSTCPRPSGSKGRDWASI